MKKDVIPSVRNNISQNPHVVILGAGASFAAFPKGDKFGRQLPLMNSLVDTLGLSKDLNSYKTLFGDFEKLYGTICKNESDQQLRMIIEEKTYEYFYEMEIVDTPTLYDYLILSLRKKDIIATFNWDPLLLQALRRHAKFQDYLPQILFMHGNVAVGYCESCNLPGYNYNVRCRHCHKPYKPLQLLYPIEKKDYNSDKFIKEQWDHLTYALKQAYFITIFGYSAPTTDVEARKLILDSIKANRSRAFS